MAIVLNFIHLFAQVLTIAIFVRAILSWFPISQDNPLVVIMNQITDPILAPLRRVIPRLGMIDITPFIAILLLQALSLTVQSLS